MRREELRKLLTFDELTDDDRHLPPFDVGDLLVVVLHEDRAVPQGIELSGVGDGGLAHGVAVGVVELGCATNAGRPLDDDVNLALPATSERPLDVVLPRHAPPQGEVEPLDLAAGIIHEPVIIAGTFSPSTERNPPPPLFPQKTRVRGGRGAIDYLRT